MSFQRTAALQAQPFDPLERALFPAIRIISHWAAELLWAMPMFRKNEPNGPVVVVADDDPDVRELLRHALHNAGYDAHVAMDVIQAVDRLKDPGVCAAILDMLFVNSAGYSGMDLLEFVRRDAQLANVPVLVITGFPLNAEVRAKIESLRAEVWHKPFDPMELVHRLHNLVVNPASL